MFNSYVKSPEGTWYWSSQTEVSMDWIGVKKNLKVTKTHRFFLLEIITFLSMLTSSSSSHAGTTSHWTTKLPARDYQSTRCLEMIGFQLKPAGPFCIFPACSWLSTAQTKRHPFPQQSAKTDPKSSEKCGPLLVDIHSFESHGNPMIPPPISAWVESSQ